jgi:glycosyltransferase involved in cell wall biosynthesis
MTERISVIIPAHNEEEYIGQCLKSVRAAARKLPTPVEAVVVLNRCTDRTEAISREYGATIVHEDARNLSRIRNAGIRASTGSVIVTIDADSWMSDNMLAEVSRRLAAGRYVGGGVRIKPESMSVGIFFSMTTFAPRLLLDRTCVGMFWTRREYFDAVGGFNEDLVSAEDVAFAKRLRAFGLTKGLRYGIIMRAHIVTSCRKFDLFGDWYLFRNRRLVSRILTGRDREAADHFYYSPRQTEQGQPNVGQNPTVARVNAGQCPARPDRGSEPDRIERIEGGGGGSEGP